MPTGHRAALREIRTFPSLVLMAEIDEGIEAHGGWPGAFQTTHGEEERGIIVPLKPPLAEPSDEERYVACVPLVSLKVAAGAFSGPQEVENDAWEWVAVDTRRSLRPGMFVAQVVGKSMEPAIQDGSYCLFAAPVTGARQGKTVLVQLRDTTDPETGERFTVKRYESEKSRDGGSWRHGTITLQPSQPGVRADRLQRCGRGQATGHRRVDGGVEGRRMIASDVAIQDGPYVSTAVAASRRRACFCPS